MATRTTKWTGWGLTIILALLFSFSAFMKFTKNEMALTQAASMGLDATTYWIIGVVELLSLVLFIVPRTGVLGTMLLAAYMGGAIVTHIQHQQPAGMAIAIQIILWITAVIRFPELRSRLFATAEKA